MLFRSALGVATFDSDNTIVAAGRSGGNFAVARYSAQGTLLWKRRTNFGGTDVARGVSVTQSDNTIVVAGSSGGNFAVARYTPSGALDTSFSGNGKLVTNFGGTDVANGVSVTESTSKPVVAGTSGGNFAVARYLA